MKNNVKDSSKLFLIACIFMILCGAFSAVGGVKTVLFAYGDTNRYIRLLSLLQTFSVVSLLCAIVQIAAGFFGLRNWDDASSCLMICAINLPVCAAAYLIVILTSGLSITVFLPLIITSAAANVLYIIGALLNKSGNSEPQE